MDNKNNNDNNNEVMEILKKYEGVLKGHFCLTSGLHSDTYFQCAKLYQYPHIVEKLARLLCKKLNDFDIDTIISPAIGAVIFGYEVAKNLNKRNLFVERKDGAMQLRRGYSLKNNERVFIIEDVVTTAKTIGETIDAIKQYNVNVVGYGCIVDRTCDKTPYKFVSLLKQTPMVYEPCDCPLCKEGIKIVKPGSRFENKGSI